MKILLDTHIFLWYISDDSRLPDSARVAIETFENQVFLSPVSLWEAMVKFQLGKLPLPEQPETYFPRNRIRHLIEELPLEESSVVQLARLPTLHRDPFDRMLICQALAHGLTLATVDDAIRQYAVPIL